MACVRGRVNLDAQWASIADEAGQILQDCYVAIWREHSSPNSLLDWEERARIIIKALKKLQSDMRLATTNLLMRCSGNRIKMKAAKSVYTGQLQQMDALMKQIESRRSDVLKAKALMAASNLLDV